MKKLFLLLSCLVVFSSLRSQLFYTTTSIGGKGGGTINSLNATTTELKARFLFDTQDGQYAASYSRLLNASNGKLYGMTELGGNHGNGTIFSYDPITHAYIKLYDFENLTGSQPYGDLIQASDGKLYGTTNNGGYYGRGVIFSYDLTDSSYIKLFDFNSTNGEFPHGGLLQASDSKLYGMTTNGGINDYGVIFSFDISNQLYTKLKNFSGANGKNPVGNFIQASDGLLYAMTFGGGTNDEGTIFTYNATTSVLTTQVNLNSNSGSHPYGSFLKASDGLFYATTWTGGNSNLGAIISYSPITNAYLKLMDLDFGTGAHPHGSLIQDQDSKLYGMASEGGDYSSGVLFSYDPSNGFYDKLKNFTNADGSYPYGSLTIASDGEMYGMTYSGAKGECGVVFSYNPGNRSYMKVRDFGINTSGSLINGGVVKDVSGKLYGMAFNGGEYAKGVLFSFDPFTSSYAKLTDFDKQNGANPYGSLTLASNGNFYGMTSNGGANNGGVIFSFDPFTLSYTKLKDFEYSSGSNPYGNLLQASDGKFYGLTNSGGSKDAGVIFSFDPITAMYTKLFDFGGNNGAYPLGSLMQAKDGKLYGVTYNGGINDWGIIFSFNTTNGTYKKLVDFNGTITGINPGGTLVQASNNKLYGMCAYGNSGTIFSFDLSTKMLTKVVDFTDGAYPLGSLTLGTDGKLYGSTREGGAFGNGVCFSFDPENNVYTKIQNFSDTSGKAPTYTFFTESDVALPLNLLSFNATRKGNSNLLNWITAQEINTDHFEIQRSNSNGIFKAIGNVRVLQNGKSQNGYVFTDISPLKEVNYYRLKIIDKDGRFTFSEIKTVNNADGFEMSIYPNPIHKNLNLEINSEKATDAQIKIINVNGKTVYTNNMKILVGKNLQNINLSTLSNGSYFLKFITTNRQKVLRFVKQ